MKILRTMAIAATLATCITAHAQEEFGRFHRGQDSLVVDFYKPLADKPIMLHYYIPEKGDVRKMPVLITFHGAERSNAPIVCWKALAKKYGIVVLAPQFVRKLYNENGYQFGNVYTTRYAEVLNPEELWAYSAIEPIFDYFVAQSGSEATEYDIQGHSAGGQFTHRFLIAKPAARVRRAVASNPGNWTWILPDGSIMGQTEMVEEGVAKPFKWPYSVAGSPFCDDYHINTFLARKFWVQLGSKDIKTSGKHVPSRGPSLIQGEHRLARGKNFYAAGKAYAEKNGLPCNWNISIVEGIGHQGRGVVFGKRWEDENGKRKYNVNHVTSTGAFYLIYGDMFNITPDDE